MFEKFGEFDSAEELNKAAKGFKDEEDEENLYKLAEENGIDKEDAEDYWDGETDELASETMAAVGRIKRVRCDRTGRHSGVCQENCADVSPRIGGGE